MEELEELFAKLKDAGHQLHIVEVKGDIKDLERFLELCTELMEAENANFDVDEYGLIRKILHRPSMPWTGV